MAELDAIVGEDRVDVVGHDLDQGLQEGACGGDRGLLLQMREGELAGAIDRDKQMEPPFGGLHLSDVDVEVSDRIYLEALLLGGLSFQRRQAADVMALQAAMQR
jgi:hypothetical protein